MLDSEPTILDVAGIAARMVLAVALGTVGIYLVGVGSDPATKLLGVAMMYAAFWVMAAVFKEG